MFFFIVVRYFWNLQTLNIEIQIIILLQMYQLGVYINQINLFDLHSDKKLETSPSIMTSNFQELKSNYTDKEHIYTDGSKDYMKGSCAVSISQPF